MLDRFNVTSLKFISTSGMIFVLIYTAAIHTKIIPVVRIMSNNVPNTLNTVEATEAKVLPITHSTLHTFFDVSLVPLLELDKTYLLRNIRIQCAGAR